MARRRSRAEQKKHTRDICLLVAVAVLLIAVVGSMTWMFIGRDVAPDAATLCPADGPLGQYVVLIDNTDPYPHNQKAALTQRLKTLAEDRIPEGYLLSVFVLGEDFTQNDKPVFEKCNPGMGEGRSAVNSNLQRIKHRFAHEFVDPVEGLTAQLLLSKAANTSPVFEMIQLAAINGFNQHKTIGRKELIIFSDMIANTPSYSMYKTPVTTYRAFRSSAYGQRAGTDLSGVNVELNVIRNNERSVNTIQTQNFGLFWTDFFDGSGARVREVNTLEGL